ALALDLQSGVLIDYYNGLQDLQAGRIRAIGSARERFCEDGLRPVRACRFSAVLGFAMDPDILAALQDPTVRQRTAMIAVERFSAELHKAFQIQFAGARMIQSLQTTDLISIFWPSDCLGAYPGLDGNAMRRLASMQTTGFAQVLAYWLYLLFPAAGAVVAPIARSWKLARQESKATEFLIEVFQIQTTLLNSTEPKKAAPSAESLIAIKDWLARIKQHYHEQAGSFLKAIWWPPGTQELRELCHTVLASEPLTIADLQIQGTQLQEYGLRGAQIGACLRCLQKQVWLHPEFNYPEQLAQLIEQCKQDQI
ncbi:MAG: CCA tRNA nucleotidyltransferase, partial [Leptospiraceae bacterium]|nr:CCA tRNA nucleotidyltransferase [Leptospiraceae bacterium]